MKLPALLFAALLSSPAWSANITVENAWIREPAPGQAVVGGYLDITSQEDASLVKADSAVAGMVQLHEMSMKDGVMQMRQVDRIVLPKGKTVKLGPGGLHLMFMDLKQPLKAGDKVPLTLKVKTGANLESLAVTAEVRSMMPSHGPMPMNH